MSNILELINENCRLTTCEIENDVEIPKIIVSEILIQDLKMNRN